VEFVKKKINTDGKIVTTGDRVFHGFINIIMIVLCLTIIIPFLLVIGASLQSQKEINEIGYKIIPKIFSLEAYQSIVRSPKIILDSYWVTFYTTLIGVALGTISMAGYAYSMSRKEFKYRNILNWANIFSMLFNGGMVATYIVITRWFHLKNNFWVLILPLVYAPFYVILMKSFFVSIPDGIVEAARIDGANEYSIFFKFVIPMSKPIFATIALFLVLLLWNDYQASLLYISKESLYKLQYLLMKILNDMDFLNSAAAADMGVQLDQVIIPTANLRMAMCVVAAGPILLVIPFFQKYFTKGISLGGIKE